MPIPEYSDEKEKLESHHDVEIQKRISTQCEIIESIISASESERPTLIGKYTERREAELINGSASPKVISITTGGSEGYIRPTTEIKAMFILEWFLLNDSTVYQDFVALFSEMRVADWKDKTVREMLGTAVLTTANRYFGNAIGSSRTHLDRQSFYLDRSSASSEAFGMRELKGKGIAECIEKSALTNNLLAFMGLDTKLVISTKTKLTEDAVDLHAFTYVNSGKAKSIVDITNPVMMVDENGTVTSYSIAVYPLTSDQVSAFERGEEVTVQHTDYKQDGEGNNLPVISQRRYCVK